MINHPKDLKIVVSKYLIDDQTAVALRTPDGIPYATLSVNVEDAPVLDNEFVVKTYSENEGLAEIYAHHFEDTGKRVSFGFVKDAPIWRLK